MIHRNLLLANPAGDEKLYVEDVFNTWLYTGNGSSQTIANGIDLAGKGGLVWIKSRSAAANHVLTDTARGAYSSLASNTTDQKRGANTVTAFNSTGFTVTNDTLDAVFANTTSVNGTTYASWTFRKAPKFFDVVTYTGNGTAGRTISHALGVEPGMIIVKRTDTTGDWITYNRALGSTKALLLNLTNSVATTSVYWNNTPPTQTAFSVGTNASVNASGGTYVAYLFAHDTTADGVIQCGSFTTDASSNATVNLGWEPQFVLFKASSTTGSWRMYDNMRGIATGGNDAVFYANLSSAEDTASNAIDLNATGFSVSGQTASATFIYLAIRRGPMRVPTDATKVFNSQIYTGDYTTSTPITGMNPGADVWWNGSRTPAGGFYTLDRLRGWYYWIPSSVGSEGATVTWSQQTQTSLLPSVAWWGGSRSQVNYFINRAPSFMDVVCYTGTGANTTQAHNLGVAPELMIVKRRNLGTASAVYSSSLANTEYLVVSSTAAKATGATYWNSTTPTSSVFSIGTSTSVNASGGTYVAYLFASCPGVSKVGSYTGYTSQTINCGFANGARFVLIKRTDAVGDYYVWDTTRGIIAANDPYMLLNSTALEVTNTDYIDPVSNGFAISSTAPDAINKIAGISWSSTTTLAGSIFQPNAVGYGNGLYLAGGTNGTLYTTSNLITWTSRTSGFGSTRIFGIAYGNGTYVIVGLGGKIASSTDGITWTLRTSGFGTSNVINVIFANGIFVAVGNAGKIATSSDGITWTLRNSATDQFYSVTYGNGLFVAVDAGGQTWTSTDAITWSISATGLNNLYSVTYGNGLFVAGGLNGNIYTSPDAITWTSRTNTFGATIVTDIAFGNGVFVAIGDGDGVTAGPLHTSTDGITWTVRGQSILFPTGVIFAENTFRCFGYDASGYALTANSSPGQYIYLAIA